MAFDLGKFFGDIFKPAKGEIVTVMYDLPHGEIKDRQQWQERRKMAEEWRQKLTDMAGTWGITVNPSLTYDATGGNNADLPRNCKLGGKDTTFDDVINSSTIVIAMPEFSATAPLFGYAKKSKKLRVGSMPGVAKFMEETGLSADYAAIAEKCKTIAAIFNKATGAEVEFSTGQKCYFDISVEENHAHLDDGILHPSKAGTDGSLSNLPAGEVYCVPNENSNSKTSGELPHKIGNETAVYVVKNNKIVDVKGNGKQIEEMRAQFKADPAWCNIAEFAIGLNDKAKVTGIILEDEKAGFHWAYGRSDHFGGKIGVKDFVSGKVVHQDVVYAKESPIICKKLDMIFPDNTRKTMIVNGVLQV